MVNTIPSSSNTISLSDGSNKDITHLSKEELIALLKNPQVAKHDKPKIQAKLQLLSTLKSKAITIDRSYLDQIDHEYFLKEKANIINMLNALPLSEETYFCTALKKIFDTPKDQYSAYQWRLFELMMTYQRIQQGLTLGERVTLDIEYYSKIQDKSVKSTIQNDIPVIKDGKLRINEAKSYIKMLYGLRDDNYKQREKYQSALDQKLVGGVSLIMKWSIAHRLIEKMDNYPDIEVVYHLKLPSGKYYQKICRTVENGLWTFNANDYDERDKAIIAKLKDMDIQDLFKIIDTTLGVKPQELIKYTNAEQLQTYEEKRHQHVWERITDYLPRI